MAHKNRLYYGDNLDVLPRYIADESVDLIYLDPPFNSNANYNVLFKEQSGTKSAAQIRAFEDTWEWDTAASEAYTEMVERGGDVSKALQAFHTLLGDSDMLAYLAMMAPRLVELRRVLKTTGQIYLHCDPTASHYLKLLMDATFGAGHFLDEVIWHYQTSGGAPQKTLIRDHDTIFRYSKASAKNVTWNKPREPWPESTLKKWQKDEEGRIYHIHNDTGTRYYIDPAGKLMDDVWDITLAARSSERLGYPTQKPLALMDRIIQASSNEGDIVLDPFCGCGTTVASAQRLKRRWIGIDITNLAISLIKKRLIDTYGEKIAATYETVGEPVSLDDAKALAAEDKYQFQWWALGLVGARPTEEKKGADRGIDGQIYFHDDESGETKQIILSVKGGGTDVKDVRDLGHVVRREKAAIGVLITLEEPTKPMRKEAASGEFYISPWGAHPVLQILTIKDLLDGKGINRPPTKSVDKTFTKARKAKAEGAKPAKLFDDD